MRNILIIGAGRSASSLIKYLLNNAETERLHLIIADLSLELAQKKTNNHPNATPIQLDIANIEERQQQIQKADIVISMLPAHLHVEIAEDCIIFKKHMVTASYISPKMQELDAQAKENGLNRKLVAITSDEKIFPRHGYDITINNNKKLFVSLSRSPLRVPNHHTSKFYLTAYIANTDANTMMPSW